MQRVAHLELSEIAKDSSKEALFSQLVRTQHGRALSTAYRMLRGERATAEDVVQDAFLRAYRGLDKFRGESQLSTWFFTILIREVRGHQRRSNLRNWLTLDRVLTPAKSPPEQDVGLQKRITLALEALTERQRTAFVLIYLEEFSLSEAAEIMGCAPGSMKSHLSRARKHMRSSLKDIEGQLKAKESKA